MAAATSGRNNKAFLSSEQANDSQTQLLVQQSAVIPSVCLCSFRDNPNDIIYEQSSQRKQ